MRYFQENTSYDEKTYIENMSDDDRDIDIESDVSTKICYVQYFVNNANDLFFICTGWKRFRHTIAKQRLNEWNTTFFTGKNSLLLY